MKLIFLLFVCVCSFYIASAQRPFITIWNTKSIYDSTHITFYATGNNFQISWINMSAAADTGNAVGVYNGENTITFPVPGIYKVYITPGKGSFNAISFYNGGASAKLLSIEQWGDIKWSDFYNAFANCSNMIMNAQDKPNLRNVTDMSGAFSDCHSLTTNAAMNNWNVSNVTDMDYMFANDSSFNQSIGNWDMSNVTTIAGMFYGASSFNQPIGNWDMSNVTLMADLFQNDTSFNQPIGNWNVSNVNDLEYMFAGARSFNQPIGNWDVSHVGSMEYMFAEASSFNQPIGDWNVSNVGDMFGMFLNAKSFNQSIGNWDVSNVMYMRSMFAGASSFNQSLGNWKLNGLYDFYGNSISNMLDSCGMNCSNYSQTLIGWAANPALPEGQFFGAANLNYDSALAKAAHDSLINVKGWTITGDIMGQCSVLPVSFLSFTVTKQQQSVVLNWQTANEINNDYFSVERSSNSRIFTEINKVYAKENPSQKQSYTTTDTKPFQGTSYYRLKQVDKDGKFTYSKIAAVLFEDEMKITIHPNPANNFIYVDGLKENISSNISISDVNGKRLLTGETTQTSNKINIKNLASGLYYISINQNGKSFKQKIVKQ